MTDKDTEAKTICEAVRPITVLDIPSEIAATRDLIAAVPERLAEITGISTPIAITGVSQSIAISDAPDYFSALSAMVKTPSAVIVDTTSPTAQDEDHASISEIVKAGVDKILSADLSPLLEDVEVDNFSYLSGQKSRKERRADDSIKRAKIKKARKQSVRQRMRAKR